MPQPNIILILTDHFRRDAIGASTPNLQALAAEGTLFENAYCAAPLCQPARCSIITGAYPSHHGVCGNQSPPIPDTLRDHSFMNELRVAGYFTAMIGKHHYIDRYGLGVDVRDDDDELKRYGFDHVFQVVDDGENAGDYGIWDKRFFYEQSCGVPLIVSGPGIPAQDRMNGTRRSKAPASHLDLFPTIMGIAGVPMTRKSLTTWPELPVTNT